MDLNKKVVVPIIIIVAVFLVGVGIVFSGVADDMIFDMIPYNYTSFIDIPNNTAGGGSLGGYYNIQGKGRDFTFQVKIPGAQAAYANRGDTEFLAYTEEGLNGTGKIESIDININTLNSLIAGDLKGVIFETPMKGVLDYSCAGWTGDGTFNNNGTDFTGTFVINGMHTYWEGNFTLENDNGRILMPSEYILYPQGHPEQAKKVNMIFKL
ncbi:MAG: hypothetical protein QME14_03785 [Methanobacteriaceae archaeon]|nr:hypothetical protein [Methanobacteriaceae archaeon]